MKLDGWTLNNTSKNDLEDIDNLSLRIEVYDYRRYPITAFLVDNMYSGKKGESGSVRLKLNIDQLAQGADGDGQPDHHGDKRIPQVRDKEDQGRRQNHHKRDEDIFDPLNLCHGRSSFPRSPSSAA